MPSPSIPPELDFLEPFGDGTDPGRYVPLATSERILADLADHIGAGRSPILLSGPSGMGKTLLLRVLGEFARVSGQRVVYSPFLHVDADACARWLLEMLGGEAADGACAERALIGLLRTPESQPAILLVDELEAAPEPTVRKLAELARAARPALAVVAAGSDGAALRRRVTELAPDAGVRFPRGLPEKEIDALCGATLAQSEVAPAVRKALALERPEIVRAASGVPGLLKVELDVRMQNMVLSKGRRRPPIEELSLDAWLDRAPGRVAGAAPAALPPAQTFAVTLEFDEAGTGLPPVIHPGEGPAAAVARDPEHAALARELPAVLEAIERRVSERNARRRLTGRVRGGAAAGRGAAARALHLLAMLLMLPVRAVRGAWHGALATLAWSGRFARARAAGAQAGGARTVHALRGFAATARRATGRGAGGVVAVFRRVVAGLAVGSRGLADGLAHGLAVVVRGLMGGLAIVARGLTDGLAAFARGLTDGLAVVSRRLMAALAGSRAAALTFARRAALPATGLVALALLLSLDDGIDPRRVGPRFEPGAPQLGAPPAEEAMPVTAHLSDASAPEPALYVPIKVQTQINARPWARIRIDGIDVGPTPLTYPLEPGVYRIEAEFPDGRSLRRQVEIGPERRFVALP